MSQSIIRNLECKRITSVGNLSSRILLQQNIATDVCDRIRQLYLGDNPFVAGGAPRDWLENRPANDIDIYVPVSDAGSQSYYLSQLRAAFGPEVNTWAANHVRDEDYDPRKNYETRRNLGILGVYELTYRDTPIQIMFVDKKVAMIRGLLTYRHSIVARFAASCSMVYYSPFTNGFYCNAYYIAFRNSGRIFINDNEDSARYVAKIRGKYPFNDLIPFSSEFMATVNGGSSTNKNLVRLSIIGDDIVAGNVDEEDKQIILEQLYGDNNGSSSQSYQQRGSQERFRI